MIKVYADNAATTRVKEEVVEAMIPYFTQHYGNPSSLYEIGADALKALDAARLSVATQLGAKADEIMFTSGGSESDNYVIRGVAEKYKNKGRHIISTKFEHHAVLHALEYLEKNGYEVTYLDVYENGIVKPEDVRAAIRDDTTLVTVMFANNEIGTVQPIAEIGKIAHEKGVLFHTDAVQAVGHIPINVEEMNIDMLSLSAHKFHGPKGVGALYIKHGLKLPNLIFGGGQERGRRAGTENVAGAVGLAKALEMSCASMDETNKRLLEMREKLIDGVLKIPYTRLNGDRKQRLPGNANFSIEYIEGESILLMMDLNGIAVSSGSACTSGSLDPSHVLLAIGLSHEVAHGSLRITLGDENTMEDVDYILEVIPKVVDRLRAMSPVYEEKVLNK
ncbi:MAG: cysteine desulfurase NifS [Bacillota bacterium]|nr:cysteine desulfurase NifS [Bacillota bacterium]